RIYVAAWSLVDNKAGDIFRSTDGGQSWKALKGMSGMSVRALEIAPSDPKTIVAGALDGVYRSSNGGDSWEKITPDHHPDLKNFESVAVDPLNPNVIYAGTWHLPWKTTDGGKTFKRMTGPNVIVNDVMIDPRNNKRVLLATDRSGVLSSVDGAVTFTASNRGFAHRQITALVVDRDNSDTLYTGVINDKE